MTLSTAGTLSEQDIDRLFGALLGELRTSKPLTDARVALLKAGITGISSPQYWEPFLSGADREFHKLEPEARFTAIRILADQLSEKDSVRALLAEHGFEYVDGTFVPTAILDRREARYLPVSSASELSKAMKRLAEGDETGAITAACGAVDTLMQHLYASHGIGDPANVAFAAKVNTAAQTLRIFDVIKTEMVALGMKVADADVITTEMRKATNHAAQMLQTLRRTMGDVHGSKPALRRAAYDAIKWSSAICGLFEGI